MVLETSEDQDEYTLTYFDSKGDYSDSRVGTMLEYLEEEYRCNNDGQDLQKIETKHCKGFEYKKNDYDCGVYLLAYAKQMVKRQNIPILQRQDMALKRYIMPYEILTNRILEHL